MNCRKNWLHRIRLRIVRAQTSCPWQGDRGFSHHVFKEITEYLHEGDCLVINDTKVIPARLIGSKVETNAKIEVLLLKRKENNVWETLVKPGKKAKVGAKISFGDGLLMGEVIDVVEEGNRLIKFDFDGNFWRNLRPAWPDAAASIYHTPAGG